MKLIILLLCILLQTINIRSVRDRYGFFDHYVALINPLLIKFGFDKGGNAIIGLLLPLLLLIFILNLLFIRFPILYLIYGTIVLFICLDIRDMKAKLEDYFAAIMAENQIKAHFEAEIFANRTIAQDRSLTIRAVTESMFAKSLTNIFSVIFWFLLLGPFGAVFYYLIAGINDRVEKSDLEAQDSYTPAGYLKDILDWIPVRLVTLTYALIGHFKPVFSQWLDRLGDGVTENQHLLMECGLTALDIDKDPMQAQPQENHLALELINRTLWTWVIVIAVLDVTSWLF